MPGLEYQHIGHDPSDTQVAIWSIDDRGELHEQRAARKAPTVEWLDWSHENVFAEVKMKALGRVEIESKFGSIHISDPNVILNTHRFSRMLSKLDQKYPQTRWYLFGSGYKGESVMKALEDASIR
jgi:hypothetical protein